MISHKDLIFPIAIACHNTRFKVSLDPVLELVRATDWAGMSVQDVAQFLHDSEAVGAVTGDKWYPAPICAKPAIYSH